MDIFRGITIFLMVFVNLGGGNYWFLNHTAWNGLTIADVVFPWFIWIMGVSSAFGGKKKNQSKWSQLRAVFIRAAKLFLIGVFVINNAYDLNHMRIPGVLQRIAICYFIVNVAFIFIPKYPVKHSLCVSF